MGYQRRVHGIPQIRPINWLILFIYFNISLYISIVKLYYMRNIKIESSNSEFKLIKNNFLLTI